MSLSTDKTVPFEIPEISHGFKEASGLMKLWERGLELEFEVATLGLFKSGVQTARLAYDDLNKIEYKKGWIKDKIVLEGISMRVFEDVPGTEIATCKLNVKKKNREEAQSLVSTARMQLSEHKLNQMDDKN
jgi:hypothetical protein